MLCTSCQYNPEKFQDSWCSGLVLSDGSKYWYSPLSKNEEVLGYPEMFIPKKENDCAGYKADPYTCKCG